MLWVFNNPRANIILDVVLLTRSIMARDGKVAAAAPANVALSPVSLD